jgi:hypothetical protein
MEEVVEGMVDADVDCGLCGGEARVSEVIV